MDEAILYGQEIRLTAKQFEGDLDRELNILFLGKREDELTISKLKMTLDAMTVAHKTVNEQWEDFVRDRNTWERERRALLRNVDRAQSRQLQAEKVVDETIMHMITACIIALLSLGYAIWLGNQ